jgi:DNA (cytosine-5)-methyltransferase 1
LFNSVRGRTDAGLASAETRHTPSVVREPNDRPIAVDLFAGAGGLSLGALQVRVDVVAAIEKDRNACLTYRANLITSGRTYTKLFAADILEIDPEDVMTEVGLRVGDCDMLLGGPPCQGFSSHRLKNSGVDDPRNALLIRYFDFVRILRPRFFLVENVPGMLWDRHREFLNTFYKLADENDYELPDPVVLNARDYGVPQNRKRVFLFGTDRRQSVKCNWPPPPTHFSPQDVATGPAAGREPWRVAAAVFAIPPTEDDENNIHMNHNAELTAAFERTPINGGSRFQSGRVLPCHKEHGGHYDVYGRIDPALPGPTMTTACINPSKGRFVHPTEPHGITLRQAARFQTFPDWFVFQGGLMSGGEQVGNAVPVEMASALVEPLADACRRSVERRVIS